MSRPQLRRSLITPVSLFLWLMLLAGCGGRETPTPTPMPTLPLPSPTPTSALPTSTPTPTLTPPALEVQVTPTPGAQPIWTRVEDREEIRSYRLRVRFLIRFPETGKELVYLNETLAVDRDQKSVHMRFQRYDQPAQEFIRIGSQHWQRQENETWRMAAMDAPFLAPFPDLLAELESTEYPWRDQGWEEVNGLRARHLVYKADAPVLPLTTVTPILDEIGMPVDSVEPFAYEIQLWVTKDGLLVQAIQRWEVRYHFSNDTTQAAVEEYSYQVWDVNAPLDIRPPLEQPQAPVPVPPGATLTSFQPERLWWYQLQDVTLEDLVDFYAVQAEAGAVTVVDRVGPEEYGYVRWLLSDPNGKRWRVMALPTGNVIDLTIMPENP